MNIVLTIILINILIWSSYYWVKYCWNLSNGNMWGACLVISGLTINIPITMILINKVWGY